MRHIVILGIIFLTIISCKSKNSIDINGEIKGSDKTQVYLEQMNIDKIVVIDSTKTNRSGKFSFRTKAEQPTFFSIKVGKDATIPLLCEPGNLINISGTLDSLENNYRVEGSENSLTLKVLNAQLNTTKAELDSLQKAYNAIPRGKEYDAQRIRIAQDWDSAINHQLAFSRDFILKHATSLVSYYALYQKIDNNTFILSPEADLHSYKVVASSMKAFHPESPYTTAILNHLKKINKDMVNQKMQDLIQNSENNLPDIALPNLKGDTVALSSLRGKYIVIDFTVLTAKEYQSNLQDLKKIYNKYHGKGLEIYQVCLDKNKLLWEDFVKRQDIPWICVWDDKAEKSMAAKIWNIQVLPANYIVNKQYEIVGKNLTGQRLEDRLKDILK